MNILPLLSLLFISFSISATEVETTISSVVNVPVIYDVNTAKKDFIREMSYLSRQFFHLNPRSALAPMGGSKITPLLELDLDQLVIVTDSYPGTPREIKRQFESGSYDLKRVMENALRSGSMNTKDVLEVNIGAQILSRLKLEMGVQEVTMKYWTDKSAFEVRGHRVMRERKLSPQDTPVATTFDFKVGNRNLQIVLISASILPDKFGERSGIPDFVRYFMPVDGFHWVYLSADDLGFFSAHPQNGLTNASEDLIRLLRTKGNILLDYPTDNAFHTPEVYGDIRFKNGRKDLSEIQDMRLMKIIRVERPGVFGHCSKTGDEVRIYQKTYSPKHFIPGRGPLRPIGASINWTLK
jgi:hypothetical protein